MPPDVAARFGPTAPILVVARHSSDGGSHGRQQAAQDAVSAVQALANSGVIVLSMILVWLDSVIGP